MIKTFRLASSLAAAYLLLAVLFTWPLATNMTSHGFGVDEDAPYHIWHNWWLKFSLFDLHQNPLYTDYIFHPQKIPLVYDANAFVFGALTIPLQFITHNVVLSSNIVFLLSFVLSGLSLFYLAKYTLSLNKPRGSALELSTHHTILYDSKNLAAFFAGLIFAFSPYTLAQAIDGHTNLTTTWIIPFYTFFLLKSLETHPAGEKITRRVLTGKYPILTGLLAALQLYNDFTYTAFMIILTALILAYHIFRASVSPSVVRGSVFQRCRLPIQSLVIITVVSFTFASPIIWPALKLWRSGFHPGSPLWVQNEWAADLLAFFRPNDRTTFLTPFIYTPPRGTVEGTVYLGWTVIVLSLFTVFRQLSLSKIKNWKLEIRNSPVIFWFFLAAAFFILSLGPFLHFGGRWRFQLPASSLQLPIPLPWILIHKIPFIGEIQEPTRINPFLMMPLAILAAHSLAVLFEKLKTQRFLPITNNQLLTTIAASTLILFEYLSFPFPTTSLQAPEVYRQIRNELGQFAVLTLPLGFNSGQISLGPSPIGSLQFYQTVHQKPSFRGTVARLPSWAFDYYRNLPLIKYFLNPQSTPDADDTSPEKVVPVFRNQLRIKYIVMHKDKYREAKFPTGDTEKLIKEVLGAEKIYEEGEIVGYKLR